MRGQCVEVNCTFLRETDAAVLIEVDGDEHWIPLSQVESMHKSSDGDGCILVSHWIADQKGLI